MYGRGQVPEAAVQVPPHNKYTRSLIYQTLAWLISQCS